MKQISGNLWDYLKPNNLVIITVNGFRKANGTAVMGRGTAKAAADKFPQLPYKLGDKIKELGNHVHHFPEYGIATLPVKHNWWETADIPLIKRSIEELEKLADELDIKVFMPRPGCGNGALYWDTDVRPLLEHLGEKYTVVDWGR